VCSVRCYKFSSHEFLLAMVGNCLDLLLGISSPSTYLFSRVSRKYALQRFICMECVKSSQFLHVFQM
jgi:hypothetical protein